MIGSISRRDLVAGCAILCILNVLLTLGLAGAGVLKTVETGDISYSRNQPLEQEELVIPDGSDDRFVDERPTDADAYYNAVVRIRNGGPLYAIGSPAYQVYHYAPIAILIFAPLAILGYVPFKVGFLIISVACVAGGTYLLLQAELRYYPLSVSTRSVVLLSVASVGFAPMVSNFKVAQTTPLMYAAICGCWWTYRQDRYGISGLILTLPMLIKPYLTIPMGLFWHPNRFRGVIGFLGGFALMNALGVLLFDISTLVRYYRFLLEAAVGSTEPVATVNWSVETLAPLFWAGPLTVPLRILAGAAFGTLVYYQYLTDHDYSSEVFAASLTVIPFIIQQATNIDFGVLLATFVVLGFRLADEGMYFELLVGAFLLAMAHPYTMMALVGRGHPNLLTVAGDSTFVHALIPFLQPGMYSLYLLVGLAWCSLRRRGNQQELFE